MNLTTSFFTCDEILGNDRTNTSPIAGNVSGFDGWISAR